MNEETQPKRPELYAWRCSPAFADALATRHEEGVAFVQNVIIPWNAEHDPIKVGLMEFTDSHDRRVIGFHYLPEGIDVPEGLSSNKRRGYLVPAKTKKGDKYREILAKLNRIPKVDEVFDRFNVPVYIMDGAWMRRCGITFTDQGVYISCKADLLGGHLHSDLTSVRLSVYYAAKERQDEIEANRQAELNAAKAVRS